MMDHHCKVHEAATRYLIYVAKGHLKTHAVSDANAIAYRSTVHEIAYAIREYLDFLAPSFSWELARDSDLEKFKHRCQQVTAAKKVSRTAQTAMGTANRKLIAIYDFYWWAQEEARLISGRIGAGPGFAIRSSICEYRSEALSRSGSRSRKLYPLLERGIAARNRHRHQHYAEPTELSDVKRQFRERQEFSVAERNVVLVDLMDLAGWRRGSVASLKTDQFERQAIQRALEQGKKTWTVTPDVQKFGYQFSKDIPIQTALRLSSYVDKGRSKILSLRKRGEETACKAIFLSYTTCKPLTDKAITQILSSAFQRLGVRKGAGAHSLRRGYGRRRSQEIIAERKRRGMSLDPRDITADLAEDLGHSSTAAQSAYTAGKKSMYVETVEAGLRSQLEEQRLEADDLRRKIAELERQTVQSSS